MARAGVAIAVAIKLAAAVAVSGADHVSAQVFGGAGGREAEEKVAGGVGLAAEDVADT